MRHSKLRLAIHTLAIVPFALPLLANAQQQLEEVLVTAEKREQSIQDVQHLRAAHLYSRYW